MSCKRRSITATVFDAAGNTLGVGTNGPLVGDCNCPGRDVPASQGGPDTLCFGMHAEVMALLAVSADKRASMAVLQCTKAPCAGCTKILLGTPITTIRFSVDSKETANRDLWRSFGRHWEMRSL
jgi:deoxycytidylate deaminase